MRTLFLFNDSLFTAVITSSAYSEFTIVTEMSSGKQMGNGP